MPELDELLTWAKAAGVAAVRHPAGTIQVPGPGGSRMTWAELAAALVDPEKSPPDRPLSLSEIVGSYNEELGLQLHAYVFRASDWHDSQVTFIRGAQVLETMTVNDPGSIIDVLTVLRRKFAT